MSRGKIVLNYWLPVLLWMAVIFAGSSNLGSTQRTSRIIGPLLRWLKPDISDEAIRTVQLAARKGAHMAEYAVLSVLLWRAGRRLMKKDSGPWHGREAALVLGITVLYAVSDEFHQSFVSSRQGQWSDVLIDAVGAMLGLTLLWTWGRWQRRW